MTDKPKHAHKSLQHAKIAAQAEMERAAKSKANPAFKSKYADLGSVMDACMTALNEHGIAVSQPLVTDEQGRMFVKTIFVHADSSETEETAIPLLFDQSRGMQGLGGAITYARRYGLQSLAVIAADDDDGNGVARLTPPQQKAVEDANPKISVEQRQVLSEMLDAAGTDIADFCRFYKIEALVDLRADAYGHAVGLLQKKINTNQKAAE
jgi:hypothetical protein